VVCGEGPLLDDLRREGFRVHVVENSRRVDPVADARTVARYIALFRRERYDLIHTHNPKINGLAALAARIAGVDRVVSTVHGLYSHEGQHPLTRRGCRTLERAAARLADLVLCQSAEDVMTARRAGIVSDTRLRRLGSGVDLARFSPQRFGSEDRAAVRRRLGLQSGEFAIGFIGRMVREKGIPELVEAVAHRRGWRLVLIGPDERGMKGDALTPDRIAAAANVTWLGLQEDLPPLYAALDVVTLPSHREGLPRTLLEASAMGRPMVATRIRGCREAIAPGKSGILVPPGSPRELREALQALSGSESLRERLGTAARQRAERLFDERAVFERLDLAYRELVLPPRPLRETRLQERVSTPVRY